MASLVPHVLILDDDQTFARTLSRLLAENGYEASTLSSGEGLIVAAVLGLRKPVGLEADLDERVYRPGLDLLAAAGQQDGKH